MHGRQVDDTSSVAKDLVRAKFELVRRLGDDWHDLADVLALPDHAVRRFVRGQEARTIWGMLVDRDRLADLPEALSVIGRKDLATIVDRGLQAEGPQRNSAQVRMNAKSGAAIQSAYLEQVRGIAPAGGLQDRERDLQRLAEFCAEDEAYGLWHAPPWAGKTALMATFALDPPAGIVVMPFFVTARFAGQTNSTAFTEAILEQAAAITGVDLLTLSATGRDGQRRRLIREAARSLAKSGLRLVLLVDGLDEDTGSGPGSKIPSIASLLPKVCDDGLKVVVAGRTDRPLPLDLPPDHPLQTCGRHTIAPSPHGAAIEHAARHELHQLLTDYTDSLPHEIIGMIAASGGGLSQSDIEELTGAPGYRVEQFLGGVFARSLRTRQHSAMAGAEMAYLFAHETLHEQALSILGSTELVEQRTAINLWADRFAVSDWPTNTPRYLLMGYAPMLFATGDLDRLIGLACSRRRHDRLFDYSGGDHLALTEITTAMRALCEQEAVDLVAIVRLARRRDSLTQRNTMIPSNLPAAWAALGDVNRAEALARSIANPEIQSEALTALVRALASTDPAWAERIARTLVRPQDWVWALTAVASALEPSDMTRARGIAVEVEEIARTLAEPWEKADALIGLVNVAASVDRVWAGQLAADAELAAKDIDHEDLRWHVLEDLVASLAPIDPTRAEQIARSIQVWGNHKLSRARALSNLVGVLAPTDPAWARRLAIDVERVFDIADTSMSDLRSRAEALTRLSTALATTDTTWARRLAIEAEKIVGAIEDYPHYRAEALTRLSTALAASDPTWAGRLATEAEQFAGSITSHYGRGRALTGLVSALALTDAARAEIVARSIPDSNLGTKVLATLALKLAPIDPTMAGRLAADAEKIARSIVDSRRHEGLLAGLVRSVASADPTRAEQVARSISDPIIREWVVVDLVATLAVSDPTRAEHIARTLTMPETQLMATAGMLTSFCSTNPERSEQLARRVVDPDANERQLIDLATALDQASSGRDGPLPLAVDDRDRPGRALVALATALIPLEPKRSEQILLGIANPIGYAEALASQMAALAPSDPMRVRRLQRDFERAVFCMTDCHKALAMKVPRDTDALDPVIGESYPLLSFVIDPSYRALVWVRRATALVLLRADAGSSLENAEGIAHTITQAHFRSVAFTHLVDTLTPFDPMRDRQLAAEAENAAREITNLGHRLSALTAVVAALTRVDPIWARELAAETERLASTLAEPETLAWTLADLVTVIAPTDFAWAEQVARTIKDPNIQGQALVAVAEARAGDAHIRRLLAEATVVGAHWAIATAGIPAEISTAIADELLQEHHSPL